MLSALQLIQDQIRDSRETFEATAADIKEDHVNKAAEGKALPLGAAYAHLVFSEDAIVQSMLQGKEPLYKTTWKNKTGAGSPMPEMDANWAVNNEKWSKEVEVDMEQMRQYAKAVYKETDAYVAGLRNQDLEAEADLGGGEKKTVVDIISNYIIGHTNNLAGEISAIKGTFGVKGYPF